MNTEEAKNSTKNTVEKESSTTKVSETPVEEMETFKQTEETLQYPGTDSTAVNAIAFVDSAVIKKDAKSLETWVAQCSSPQIERAKVIKYGVDLAKKIAQEITDAINLTNKEIAKRAIILGIILLKLKELTRKKNTFWTAWATENLPFIAERNREKYMRLARRTDCHRYIFLGIDRLDLLCSSTEEPSPANPDPIGKLLAEYNIQFDSSLDLGESWEFKNKIDSVVNDQKLKKAGITVDFAIVVNLTLIKFKFDKSAIKELKHIQESGGNPEARLKTLSLHKGKEPAEEGKEKRLQDFSSLASRLITTIDKILKDPAQYSKVEQKLFRRLVAKLMELQKAAGLKLENEETA